MQDKKLLAFDGFSYHHTWDDFTAADHFSLHCHNMYEIYYFIQGSGSYLVEGSLYKLQPNDLILLRPGEFHRFLPAGTGVYERCSLHFEDRYLHDCALLLRPFLNRKAGQANLLRTSAASFPSIMARLDDAICLPDELRQLMSRFLLGELLVSVSGLTDSRYVTGGHVHPLVEHVLNYINENLTAPMNLDLLAEQVYVTKYHICRVFKAYTGVSPMEYITRKRVLLARERIREGVRPTQAALDCGFSDYSTFYRAYRRFAGCSPRTMEPGKTPPSQT